MKAIMLMFDSLNRHMLSSYGCDWVHTPNFERLAKKTVVFDGISYVMLMDRVKASLIMDGFLPEAPEKLLLRNK